LEASLDIAVEKVYCGEEHTAILSRNGDIWMIGSN
jgi:alpha-tubulin suppressor-like RCC1 family protein